MKHLFVVFFVFFLIGAGPGGQLPRDVDQPQKPAVTREQPTHPATPHRFRPFLKATTTLQCLLLGGPVDRESRIGPPVHLHYLNPKVSQPHLRLVGTDLGFAFAHEGTNIILFGDTWPLPTFPQDDSLATFPSTRRNSCPVLTFPSQRFPPASRPVKPIRVFHMVSPGHWSAYPMGALKTPLAGFSSGDKAYGIFSIGAQACSDTVPCDTGDICFCTNDDPGTHARLPGICAAPAGPSASPNYPRPKPRPIAAASHLPDFYEEGYLSLRDFVNITVRVVPHFDPETPAENIYYVDPKVSFESQATRPAVLVWGKPAFVSLVNPVPTYLMYYDLTASGAAKWIPHYYTGIVAGIPQWSTVPSTAKIAPGMTPVITADTEIIDGAPIMYPAQISVSFVPSLETWIMLYGGRPPGNPLFADDPKVGIYMRHASQPWGPWSAPRRIWSAVADGGHTSFMFHPVKNPNAYDYNLSSSTEIPAHPVPRNSANDYGAEYGASIIDAMTWHDIASGKTHIYWAMSTWNPYRVVLMHTILEYLSRAERKK